MQQQGIDKASDSLLLPPIELVIFDCDGTLVDSEPLVAEVIAAAAAEYGISISAFEVHRRFKGGRLADCITALNALRAEPLPASFIETVRTRESIVLRERLQPMEGAVELLQAMHLPFCMASNGPQSKMEITLGTTGLIRLFQDRIFSAYEIGSWKPDPGLFLHAARTFGVAPQHCAVIEDSLPGILAGLSAGMRVFALTTDDDTVLPSGVQPIRSLRDLHPHLVLPVHRQGAVSAAAL